MSRGSSGIRAARRMRGWPWLAVACVVGWSSVAAADPGPTIDHRPLTSAPAHLPVALRATIVSNTNFPVYKPTVYVRTAGMTSFTRIDMQPVQGVADIFTATIPADLVNDAFDYYIEAFDKDGNGPTRTGSNSEPLHVKVGATAGTPPLVVMSNPPPSTAATPPPIASTAPAPAPAPNRLTNELLLGVGGAAAVGGAVALGVGLNDLYSWQQDSERATLHLAVGKQTSGSQLSSEHSGANKTITVGSALIGAGIVVAAVGLYLYLNPEPPSGSPAAVERVEAERHPRLASLLLDF